MRKIRFLEESKISHFNIAQLLSGDIEVLDIYAFMVLKRSLSLVFGFTKLILEKNFLCAAPLIRLQLDNLLRFHAAFLVENRERFVVDVLYGKEVRRIKDRRGKCMTDAYLQGKLECKYPWLRSLYKRTSGYIHLSDQHFFNTVRASEKGLDGVIDIYIGPDDKMVSDEIYEEAVEDMIRVTHALLTFLGNWAMNKNSLSNED